MADFDLVIGIHSIVEAIKNSDRTVYKLVGANDAISEIKKQVGAFDFKVHTCKPHEVQEEAKKAFKEIGLDYHRVPSGVFLLCSPLEIHDVPYLYDRLKENKFLKVLALDQITDVHNAGAIIRTASFYGIDLVIVPDKKSFGLTPSFFRIASGAAEHVPMVGVSKLTRTVTKLKESGLLCLALSEHAKGNLDEEQMASNEKGLCLILGREDVGISNAVLRITDYHISLPSKGAIKSLNVSTAAAISMEKCFGNL